MSLYTYLLSCVDGEINGEILVTENNIWEPSEQLIQTLLVNPLVNPLIM